MEKRALAAGLSEYLIPFTYGSLPSVIRCERLKRRLLKVQQTVCSSYTDTDLCEPVPIHRHWANPPVKVLQDKLVHGTEGASSRVSKVELGRTILARKSIHRQRINQNGAGDELEDDRQIQMALFMNELSILRQLSHRHIVELRGSYTAESHFALLLSPVADGTLEQALGEALDANHHWLYKSYGCLSAALSWMHSHGIKHRDIKPSNILVVGQGGSARVMFCDFGSALEAKPKGSLVTGGRPQQQTERYISPEASKHSDHRNESTDLWSLGCVFMEVGTILRGHRLQDLHEYVRARLQSTGHANMSSSDLCYWKQPDALSSWLEEIHAADEGPGLWTKQMVNPFAPRICSMSVVTQVARAKTTCLY